MSLTDDPHHPGLRKPRSDGQHETYLVLSAEERAKGFVRPLRRSYTHDKCGWSTKMALPICETYARNPSFYGSTYCVGCGNHYPVGEFRWDEDKERLGS